MTACTAQRHGTRAAYAGDGCRCPEARQANTDYARTRDRRTLHATWGAAPPLSVPVERAQVALNILQKAGWPLRRIVAESGVTRTQLARIRGNTARPVTTVYWSTYERLTSLIGQDPTPPGAALVDATGTWRRLEGLIALGYPQTWIAQRLGIGKALQIRHDRVLARTAKAVALLYAELENTKGPSDRTRAMAARKGYLAPGWWDEDTIDDPTYRPCAA